VTWRLMPCLGQSTRLQAPFPTYRRWMAFSASPTFQTLLCVTFPFALLNCEAGLRPHHGILSWQCFPNCVPPLWDTLLSSIGIPDLFTLDFDFTKGKPQMVMGGTGQPRSLIWLVTIRDLTLSLASGRVQTSDITWTPIIEESYYVVDLKEIDVGGIPIQFDSSDLGQTIVDR